MSATSCTIYNAITGFSVTTNLRLFLTIDDFKRFVSQQLMIPLDQTFILLPYGAKLKRDTFASCVRDAAKSEFYVFDRRLFSFAQDPISSTILTQTPEIEELLNAVTRLHKATLIKPVTSPLQEVTFATSDLDYRKITTMLTSNMGWLSALEIDAHYFHSIIQNTMSEIRVIFQCFTICSQYLKLYCFEVEKLYDSNVEFHNQLRKDSNAHQWQKFYDSLLKEIKTVNDERQKRLSNFLERDSLERDYNDLVDINRRVLTQLRQLKTQIYENIEKRQAIAARVEQLKPLFDQAPSNYEMENQMMKKFEEIIAETKESTREILALTSEELTPDVLAEVSQKVSDNKNSTIPNLLTIAQSLFSQAEESLANKKRLQEQIILLLSQIAFVQVQILDVKTVLLKECNQQLESLQNYELRLSQVEDLPILYGLHLIENLRKKNWLAEAKTLGCKMSQELQAIGDIEEKHREKWNRTFGQLRSLFDISGSDLTGFRKSYALQICSFSVVDTDGLTAEKIERYLLQLSQHNISVESLALLQKNLESAVSFSINLKPLSSNGYFFPGRSSHDDSDVIRRYQRRIKKLEALLHDAKYSNIRSWPSGILNNATLTAFENNTPPVNVKMSMLLADSNDVTSNLPQGKALDDMSRLRKDAEEYQEQIDSLKKESLKLKTLAVDFEDERSAYRETLSALNNELSKLTSEREQREHFESIKLAELKDQVTVLSKHNASLLNEVSSLKNDFEQQKSLNEKLLSDMATAETNAGEAKKAFDEERNLLREEIDLLKSSNEELVNNQIILNSSEHKEQSEEDDSNATVNHDMLKSVFEVFAGAVYILENIGLLLSRTDDLSYQISRVKGLRKGLAQSDIFESALELKGPTSIKSTVFQDVKELFDSSNGPDNVQAQRELLLAMNKLFENKLYESSVIKRFKDIEALAKKLTKENKFRRGLLETYQREKITVKNFQVGDTALFLPTRDVPDSVSSSVSSLASSFSSVDLSTPPPPGGASSQRGESHHLKNTKERVNANKAVPWAAFTAFDESTRYFLKDNEKFTIDRDWFVGNITSVEEMVANEPATNPFKLPKGTTWVQVTADFVTGKNS
ncbi:LAME_0F03026g1_1 [Lachancea meyersii CBS 8951]|uniref:Autophagy-related protein 11 n=1 Tax=Lachancea meyersii CBS 8951 TaxID=1266667 RepID=A0A1G4JQX1_9SACH|nr:LAME_0F03026g1_1 [Lachancea meyersii CBS 8951]